MSVCPNLGSLFFIVLICLPVKGAIVSEVSDRHEVSVAISERLRIQAESSAIRQDVVRTYSPAPQLIVGAVLEASAWESAAPRSGDGLGFPSVIGGEGGVNAAEYDLATAAAGETVTFSPRGGEIRVIIDPKLNVIAVLSAFLLVGSGLLVLMRRKRKRARRASARAGTSKRH